MSILVINAGSTSLKFGLFDDGAVRVLGRGSIDWADGHRESAHLRYTSQAGGHRQERVSVPDNPTAARVAISSLDERHAIHAVGHRVVHGGAAFESSKRIDARIKAEMARLATLAPLHNPPALDAIDAAEALLTNVPQVAVFDTAFFARLPARAIHYPLPYDWHARWGIRRFGFHGISNTYCLEQASHLLNRPPGELRVVTCHLGGGCSVTAVDHGQPLATTMGFTPLEGLMMGTRSGSIDPGLLLHLETQCGLGSGSLSHALNYESGLLGISGISSDLAQIEVAARQGHERAQLAFEMFAERVLGAVGEMTARMGGMDVLVFTDRIGENSIALRQYVCERLGFMNLHMDPARNSANAADSLISTPSSKVSVLIIHTEEELMLAREVARIVTDAGTVHPTVG